MLLANGGGILRIRPIGSSRHILIRLLVLMSDFPIAMIRKGMAPPNRRQYVEYPPYVVMSNIIKWFSGSKILNYVTISLQQLLTINHFETSNKYIGLTYQDAQTLGDTNAIGSSGLKPFMNVVDETNQNLTSAQKELLLWRQCWGHADFQNVRWLLCQPCGDKFQQVLKPKNPNASACSRLLCAACHLTKQRRQAKSWQKYVLLQPMW
jgi:hypothetical protein